MQKIVLISIDDSVYEHWTNEERERMYQLLKQIEETMTREEYLAKLDGV